MNPLSRRKATGAPVPATNAITRPSATTVPSCGAKPDDTLTVYSGSPWSNPALTWTSPPDSGRSRWMTPGTSARPVEEATNARSTASISDGVSREARTSASRRIRTSRPMVDRLSGRVGEPLPHVPADVERQVLHRRVVAEPEHARGHALLHALADPPVLAVHQVPELHRVRGIEPGPGHLVRVEQEVAVDHGPAGTLGPQGERRDMVRRHAEHEVGIHELTLVAGSLVLGQTGKRRPIRGPAERERRGRSEEHTSELQSRVDLVCR